MFGTAAFAQLPYATAPGAEIAASVSETVQAVEALAAVASFAPSVTETATVSDATASSFSISAATNETATVSDATASSFSISAATNETATAADTAAANTVYPTSLAEFAAASEAAATIATFPVQVSEQVQAVLNSIVATSAVLASVAESVQAADVLIGAFLWNDIDDTQNPDWTDVLRPTTITDYAVFGDANFGVTSFAGQTVTRYDPASTNWSVVDDTQNPEWAVIDAV